jgi:hypothetical protein
MLRATGNMGKFLVGLPLLVCFLIVHKLTNLDGCAYLRLVLAASLRWLLVIDILLVPVPQLTINIAA